MSKAVKLIVFVVLLILIVAGAFVLNSYLRTQQEAKRKAEIQQKLKEAQSAYQERNVGAQQKAGSEAEQLFGEQGVTAPVRLRITGIYNRFISGDTTEKKKAAADDLKAMIRDLSLPAASRAAALGMLGEFTLFVPDAVSKEIIFNDAPYDGYLREAKGDVVTAQRIIYEKSIETSPHSLYYNLIAYWYAQQLMKNLSLTKDVRSQYMKNLLTNVGQAEKYVARDLANERAQQQLFRPVRMVRILFTGAVNYGVLGILREAKAEDVEAKFKATLNLGEQFVADAPTQDQLLLVRLWYADFLRQRFGESRRTDIESLLKPLEILPTAGDTRYTTLNYLRKELAESAVRNPTRYRYIDFQDIQKLAAFEPSFRKVLVELGWKF